jgi:IS4 transposase
LVKCGKTETGTIYEQTVQATDPETGATLLLRRIEIRLFEKTRDGERVIGLLTNLPDTVSAMVIAEIYRKRWTIEISHPDYPSSYSLYRGSRAA